MKRYLELPNILLMLVLLANSAVAQPGQDTMMGNGMMGSGWVMVVCMLLGILLVIALILVILALLKYLLGK